MNFGSSAVRRQHYTAGAALVIGLMVLTMLTVFALVSTTGHLLQQKTLAAGMDRAHALQTAERAFHLSNPARWTAAPITWCGVTMPCRRQ
jgi:Tfp pilus assembly protein PilX